MAETTWNSHLDLLLNELRNAVVQNLATNPTGTAGRIYYNTADGSLRWYDSVASEWKSAATGAGYTDEQVRSVVAAMLTGGTGIDVSVSGGGSTITISVSGLTSSAISDFTAAARAAIAVSDTATLDLSYSGGTISGAVLNSPTVGGQTPAQLRDRSTHTGTQSADTLTDGSTNRLFSTAEKTKLSGIAAGATANATDAQLRDRATHTGTQLASTISDFDTQVRTSRLDQMATPTADVAMGTRKITGLGNGTAATDAINLGQLEAAVEGRKWKDPVRVATTANITLSGTQTIDGVAVVAGDRVLVKNQTSAGANGIYVVATGAWTRAADANTAPEVTNASVMVNSGTAGAGTVWTQTATIATIGTTAQTWVQTGSPGSTYTAGTGLELVGNAFRIATAAAGNGLTGGGGSALAVNTGTGLEVVSNAVRIATTAAGNGLTGGGTAALAVGAGTGITVGATTVGIANAGVGPTQLAATVAGDGLTGGAGTALAVNVGTGLEIASDAVRIATSAAGNGLTGGGGAALAVAVDNSSIEISSNSLRVKAAGITDAMLATPPTKRFATTWTGAGTSLTVNHAIGRQYVHVSVYDQNDELLHGVSVDCTSTTQCVLAVNAAPGASTWNVVVVG